MSPTSVPKVPAGPMKRIVESAGKGRLVVVIGAGVSMGLTDGLLPSWPALIKNGFEYALKKGRITEVQLRSWSSQLSSSDLDELLGAAEFIGRKLGSPGDQVYGRWLEQVFGAAEPTNGALASAIRAIASRGIPICTFNYDSLLEIATGMPKILSSETQKVMSWVRRESPGILHLHGSWDIPGSCILGIRDYETTQTDEVRDLFQRHLTAFNHLLFIGCGDTFSDPNFSELVKWLRTKLGVLTLPHVALVLESDVPKRNVDPSWLGFVEPVSFGTSHKDLSRYLLSHFPEVDARKSKRKTTRLPVELNEVLSKYQEYLLRDCGQMTIEGVSADLDTGQRRFDLERLFVPLKVSACPPEFSPSDADADAKLKKWHEENPESLPFGKVLNKNKRLALLALPGGGKTLLLKRLAVAYSDPLRRKASTDDLPELRLFPLLIRCREWRDHIHLPIATLLKSIGDITGQGDFGQLFDAVIPLLKKGQVLLLIDGLDEIHNDADRATFVEHLESFLDEYDRIRVVITSREAGFNLVAPTLSRFCQRWRLAPLADDAIELLCTHWHRLMIGDNPEAVSEGKEVSETLRRNASLRRLAENPLLLTMLLVVKHGAGGLPPDRVSLYGRAVDVLLDTWNIKGHDPLNAREAVPQLAYVAFQMMCAGKQTATERELIAFLEEARDRHPNIKRYARDSPHEFLKRVELRSSLLLEAGHQMEAGRAVPFYQFRHLTFQEYLAAVAVTEGHYKSFCQEDTILTPLIDYLLTEEWKEVVPMAAVLARKRAEPLLMELIRQGEISYSQIESESDVVWREDRKMEGPPGLLFQCFVEEAEASPKTISSALQIIAFFAHGCKTADDWESLCRGPYGYELYSQAWELFISRRWPQTSWLMNSCAAIAAYQQPVSYWLGDKGRDQVRLLLQSGKKEDIARGLLVSMGLLWNSSKELAPKKNIAATLWMEIIEALLLSADEDLWPIVTWVWTNGRRNLEQPLDVDRRLMDAILDRWLCNAHDDISAGFTNYALSCQLGMDRNSWSPRLTPKQKKLVRDRFAAAILLTGSHAQYQLLACFLVAYHAKNVWKDDELAAKLVLLKTRNTLHYLRSGSWEKIEVDLGVKNNPKRNLRKTVQI